MTRMEKTWFAENARLSSVQRIEFYVTWLFIS